MGPKPTPANRAFDSACVSLASALEGEFRQRVVADLCELPTLAEALDRMRSSMRLNAWKAGGHQVHLGRLVKNADRLTRSEGFHVLHDWDSVSDAVNPDTIAVDVLDYVLRERAGGAPDRVVLAVLLDYYLVNILALFSLRIWDDGDADDNLTRLSGLLAALQGPGGSGQRFVDDAETLILLATAHYERVEDGYDLLLARVRTLDAGHRLSVAIGHTLAMGCHLRFGFEASYGRDTVNMRDDNVSDYPWLCFALLTPVAFVENFVFHKPPGPSKTFLILGLTRFRGHLTLVVEGVHDAEHQETLPAGPCVCMLGSWKTTSTAPNAMSSYEALASGLSPDTRAFTAIRPPDALVDRDDEWIELRALLYAHRESLLADAERHRPSPDAYSPLSFFFNFSHNIVKGTVVDALLRSEPWSLTLNDLLTGLPRDEALGRSKERLATILMGYARANPDRIRGRMMPVIVYDPRTGDQAFSVALKKLSE